MPWADTRNQAVSTNVIASKWAKRALSMVVIPSQSDGKELVRGSISLRSGPPMRFVGYALVTSRSGLRSFSYGAHVESVKIAVGT